MSDWTGGYGNSRPPNAKIPAKVHRRVSLIRVREPIDADELLAHPRLGRLVVGRLTDVVLLIQPGKASEVVDELVKIGHTPQVVGDR